MRRCWRAWQRPSDADPTGLGGDSFRAGLPAKDGAAAATRRAGRGRRCPKGVRQTPVFARIPRLSADWNVSAYSAWVHIAAGTCRRCLPFRRGSCRQGGADACPRFAGAEGGRSVRAGTGTDQGPRLPAARSTGLPRCRGDPARFLPNSPQRDRPARRSRPSRSRSSTRSNRRRASSPAARSDGTFTACCWRPSGRRQGAAVAGGAGPRSPAAVSPSRSAGVSSREPAFLPACRWPSVSPSSGHWKPKDSAASRSSGRTTSCTAITSWAASSSTSTATRSGLPSW